MAEAKHTPGPLVYIINEKDTRFYKIGIARDLNHRFISICCGNPHELIVKHTIGCRCMGTARKIERFIHQSYSGHRIRGEWFELNQDDVLDICSVPINDHRFIPDQSDRKRELPIKYREILRLIAGGKTLSQAEFARHLGCSTRNVKRLFAELIEMGLIECVRRGGRGGRGKENKSIYRLLDAAIAKAEAS